MSIFGITKTTNNKTETKVYLDKNYVLKDFEKELDVMSIIVHEFLSKGCDLKDIQFIQDDKSAEVVVEKENYAKRVEMSLLAM